MNIMEMIERLQDIADMYGEGTEVHLATQPSWPLEWSIGNVIAVTSDEGEPAIAYISEGTHQGYLPGDVARELGWR